MLVRVYVPLSRMVLLVWWFVLAVLMALTRSAATPLLTVIWVGVTRSSSSSSRGGRRRAFDDRRRLNSHRRIRSFSQERRERHMPILRGQGSGVSSESRCREPSGTSLIRLGSPNLLRQPTLSGQTFK